MAHGLAALYAREGLVVAAHLLVAQLAQGHLRQDLPHERVHNIEHKPADAGRPKQLESDTRTDWKIAPRHRLQNRFHKGKRLDIAAVERRVVKAKPGAPVVQNQRNVGQFKFFDESSHIFEVFDKSVADIRLVRLSHADKIQRDAASMRRQIRDNVAPDITPGRVAVQKQNGIPAPFFNVVHARSKYINVSGLEREFSGNRLMRHKRDLNAHYT